MGKSVTVRHTSSKYLTLCEVQVFGRYTSPTFKGKFLAVPATSSKFARRTPGTSFSRVPRTGEKEVKTNQGNYYVGMPARLPAHPPARPSTCAHAYTHIHVHQSHRQTLKPLSIDQLT